MSHKKSLSCLTQFIVDALDSGRYPFIGWVNKEQGTFHVPYHGPVQANIPESTKEFFEDFLELCVTQGLQCYFEDSSGANVFGRVCTAVRRLRRAPGYSLISVNGITCRVWQLLGTVVKECWWCRNARSHVRSAESLMEILHQHQESGRRKRKRDDREGSPPISTFAEDFIGDVTLTGGDSGDEGPSSSGPVSVSTEMLASTTQPSMTATLTDTSDSQNGDVQGVPSHDSVAENSCIHVESKDSQTSIEHAESECEEKGRSEEETCTALLDEEAVSLLQEVEEEVEMMLNQPGTNPFDFLEMEDTTEAETREGVPASYESEKSTTALVRIQTEAAASVSIHIKATTSTGLSVCVETGSSADLSGQQAFSVPTTASVLIEPGTSANVSVRVQTTPSTGVSVNVEGPSRKPWENTQERLSWRSSHDAGPAIFRQDPGMAGSGTASPMTSAEGRPSLCCPSTSSSGSPVAPRGSTSFHHTRVSQDTEQAGVSFASRKPQSKKRMRPHGSPALERRSQSKPSSSDDSPSPDTLSTVRRTTKVKDASVGRPLRTESYHKRPLRHRLLRSSYYRITKTPCMITADMNIQAYYFGERVFSLRIHRDCVLLCSKNPEADVSHACLHTRGGLRCMLPPSTGNHPGSEILLDTVLRNFAAGLVVVPTTTAIYVKNLCASTLFYHGNCPETNSTEARTLIAKSVQRIWDLEAYEQTDQRFSPAARVFVGQRPFHPDDFSEVPLTIRLSLVAVDSLDTGTIDNH
ncbi:interferon regulatory factor 3 [Colobine gammaherpesvirus 1]|uniref:Interferon regulatory factor 3 n=1 Tax=Colobine gammaherpesvirus 1 TaxID=2597325 RepID=A0A5B8G8F8_9GAMA|nr:interferon regulatory factor 3 [Colobine gammaherpesvirus 1]QDQ69267.1 interferon regulatory factor 3 [Colobine gammaherpesvirus 1]